MELSERELIVGYDDSEKLAHVECCLQGYRKFLKRVKQNSSTRDLELIYWQGKIIGFRCNISKKSISIKGKAPLDRNNLSLSIENASFEENKRNGGVE